MAAIERDFAGQRRKFELRIKQWGELERLCGTGIFAIAMRLSHGMGGFADVRETVRLGLEGGGMSEVEATALTLHYFDGEPLGAHLVLASEILSAAINGLPKDQGEAGASGNTNPAT
ncbi:hypothetical protein M2322_000848 [Rhodoblastus acidophilus]|uniref:gene transfer agent family protein n=1 Tax=Rhodoblastus acidophilus TaxID=1074 RepID=UPI0022256159|nr:gene transfer agent family protein [Rhodoblastus acidophilus]MCW2315314.1 hypothetical protein [Rhodoblastus acidophilus]